jgi:regulator of sirC expression with transglutaminase-like and TPR domain
MHNDENIKSLICLLDDPDEDIILHVENQIKQIGELAIEDLEFEWENSTNSIIVERIENLIFEIKSNKYRDLLQNWIQNGAENLIEGSLLVAQYQYHNLNQEKVYDFLKKIEQDIWIEINDYQTALEKTKIINHIFYNIYGFDGNKENYHAPQNSFIQKVIEQKKGTPLSLGILYIHIAQKLDIPIYGVNVPNHFVLVYKNNELDEPPFDKYLFYINPFSNGSVFGRYELEDFIQQLQIPAQAAFFEACTNKDIVKRMIHNIVYAYELAGKSNMQNHYTKLLDLFI